MYEKTDVKKIMEALKSTMAIIVNVESYEKISGTSENITPKKCMQDLEHFSESGIFNTMADFRYGFIELEDGSIDNDNIHVTCGAIYNTPYYITITLTLNRNVCNSLYDLIQVMS